MAKRIITISREFGIAEKKELIICDGRNMKDEK